MKKIKIAIYSQSIIEILLQTQLEINSNHTINASRMIFDILISQKCRYRQNLNNIYICYSLLIIL